MTRRCPKWKGVMMSYTPFSVAKADRTHEMNEDGFFPSKPFNKKQKKNKIIGVFDGVSAGYSSKGLVSHLMNWFRRKGFNYNISETMDLWLKSVHEGVKQRSDLNDFRKSVILEMLAEGKAGGTTFNLLSFNPRTLQYHDEALGDTVFYHWREKLIAVNPEIEDFTLTPPQINSISPYIRTKEIKQLSGSFRAGDCILIATDAVAKFIQTDPEPFGPKSRIKQLLQISSQEGFQQFVMRERENGTLANDDSTLIVIRILSKHGK